MSYEDLMNDVICLLIVNYEFLIMNLLKGCVLLASAAEVRVLEELDERQSHRMDECTYHAEGEGDAVTCKQDEHHRQPTDCPRQAGSHIVGKRVEHAAKHTASQTKGEEADVTQQVAQQTCCHSVSCPDASTDIQQRSEYRILVSRRIIIKEYTDDTQSDDAVKSINDCLRQVDSASGQAEEGNRREERHYPREGADGITKAVVLPRLTCFEHHTQENLHETDNDGDDHHWRIAEDWPDSIIVEEVWLDWSKECPILFRQVDAEDGSSQEATDGCCQTQPNAESSVALGLFAAFQSEPNAAKQDEKSVAAIAQTESEEEHEERGKEDARVDIMIVGKRVHTQDGLEEARRGWCSRRS